MRKDQSEWVETLAESDEFADYVFDNVPRKTIEELLQKFAEIKLNEADDYQESDR